jgi:alkanesulfonate monooxygenase SsuD/methylene tetrahydromethanopterin reductase-like flavin-dependent oxidoreductase (luciferase family)
LAAQTSRARVGLLVTGNTYRFPAVLAKMAATVDHVSNGRLILGMGAGWFEPEHKAYGIPFYTVGERARRLGESVQVLKLLFTQSKSTFSGAYYQLADASCEPKPVQRPYPPILIGGTGPKLIQPIVARHADIWHFYVAKADREATRTLCAHFDAVCRQVGRDPATIEKSTFLLGDQLLGSPQDVRAGILSLVAAGVHHFILVPPPPYDAALLRRFAREVIPAVLDRHRGAVG